MEYTQRLCAAELNVTPFTDALAVPDNADFMLTSQALYFLYFMPENNWLPTLEEYIKDLPANTTVYLKCVSSGRM